MSIELMTKSIGSPDVYYDNFVEQGIDSDITLPDYCPDIMRILKCSLHNDISNSKISGDRATADGKSTIRLIYADEKNKIFCYEQEYPFSKYAELSGTYDNAVLSTNAKTEYVNCRAVSKRRIDIHGVISIHFRVSGTKKTDILCDATGDGVQLKKKGFDISDTVITSSKQFQMSETEKIGDNKPPIGKILNVCASPILSDVKIIKGKILMKGELSVKIIYCSDSQENEAGIADYNLMFNEIIEADGVTDECQTDVNLMLNSIDVIPRIDNEGECREITISAEINAEISAFRTQSICVIADAYSTDYSVDTKYQPMEFYKIAQNIKDNFISRESLDVSSLNPAKLYCAVCGKPIGKCSFDNDRMTINGKVMVSIILIDSEGIPVFCEREADFEYTRSMDANYDNATCKPQLEISGFSCNLTSDGRVEYKAEICVNALIFKVIKERAMTSLQTIENSEEKKKKSSVTIYFCSGGESVWDIAMKYNTTVEDIMEENNLTADYLENKSMLIIPVK